MKSIRNTNMDSTTSISLFTVTSLLSLLLLFHVLGCAEISKGMKALDNDTATYFVSNNNNYTGKPSVLYSKLDGKGVVILRGATVIDGTGSVPKANAVIIVNGSKIVNVLINDSKYHEYHTRHNVQQQI